MAVPAFSFKAAGSLIRSFGILRFLSLSAQSLGRRSLRVLGLGGGVSVLLLLLAVCSGFRIYTARLRHLHLRRLQKLKKSGTMTP